MAKSTAERQAAYRARRSGKGADSNGERKLSVWVTSGTALALSRLARDDGVTQRAIIERIVRVEDERRLSSLVCDSEEWDAYFGVKSFVLPAH